MVPNYEDMTLFIILASIIYLSIRWKGPKEGLEPVPAAFGHQAC